MLEVEAPVGYTGVFHDIPGVVPPLFVTVIVLAAVVSSLSVPGLESDGGLPENTVNDVETTLPAPFVPFTVID